MSKTAPTPYTSFEYVKYEEKRIKYRTQPCPSKDDQTNISSSSNIKSTGHIKNESHSRTCTIM